MMLKYYKQAREEIIPFGESKYKEAAPLGLFCAVAPPEVFRGEYSVIYFPIFSRSMRSFGVQSW